MSGMSLSQVEAKTPEDAVLLPPALPPPLPPMPPAALPPMPTFTWMTEDDLPKLGPPPPTTTMSTTLQPPPGLFSTGGDPAQMQADMMNGGFDHHYHYVPGSGYFNKNTGRFQMTGQPMGMPGMAGQPPMPGMAMPGMVPGLQLISVAETQEPRHLRARQEATCECNQ